MVVVLVRKYANFCYQEIQCSVNNLIHVKIWLLDLTKKANFRLYTMREWNNFINILTSVVARQTMTFRAVASTRPTEVLASIIFFRYSSGTGIYSHHEHSKYLGGELNHEPIALVIVFHGHCLMISHKFFLATVLTSHKNSDSICYQVMAFRTPISQLQRGNI